MSGQQLIARSQVESPWIMAAEAAGNDPPSMATAEHLAIINRMPGVLRELTAADVYVRGMYAANDQPMTGHLAGLRFPREELAVMARIAPGKPVHCIHDTGGLFTPGALALPVGTIFAADVVEMEGAGWLRLLFYMAKGALGRDLVQRIDSGIIREVSVQALYTWLQCSIDGLSMRDCEHVADEQYDGQTCYGIVHGVKDFIETSLVPSGAAQDTSLFMAAGKQVEGVDLAALYAQRATIDGFFERGAEPLETLFGK